jgi:hypothetical protein
MKDNYILIINSILYGTYGSRVQFKALHHNLGTSVWCPVISPSSNTQSTAGIAFLLLLLGQDNGVSEVLKALVSLMVDLEETHRDHL